jgi:ArsR family transcriptional regulator
MNRTRLERIAKALADQSRLHILETLASKQAPLSCGQIVSLRGLSAATVSHHLKILSDAGLIACRKDGQFVYCEAVDGALEEYAQALLALVPGKRGRR